MGPPLELAETIAARLAPRGEDVAFLVHRETVWHARGADELFTAVPTLVQGIHEEEPAARIVVRNTIFTTRAPGPFAAGIVKVAAKRVRLVEPRAHGLDPPLVLREVKPIALVPSTTAAAPSELPSSHGEWLRFALGLVAPPSEALPRHARDRRVGAALVSPEGRLLAASANTNGHNKTRHAELNVLAARWKETGARLAPGTRLYTTLRPCALCAGLLWELSARPGTVSAFFLEDDPGPAARNTMLTPGSEVRARFARSPEERAAPGALPAR
jgi:tRNA(Arg) A34 adenosine deaminase TadA